MKLSKIAAVQVCLFAKSLQNSQILEGFCKKWQTNQSGNSHILLCNTQTQDYDNFFNWAKILVTLYVLYNLWSSNCSANVVNQNKKPIFAKHENQQRINCQILASLGISLFHF